MYFEPTWMETKFIVLYSLAGTLNLRMYDHHEHRRHALLGEAQFGLSRLIEDAAHGGHDLPLIKDEKQRGDLLVNLAYYPTKDASIVSEYDPGIVTLHISEARQLDLRESAPEDFATAAQIRLGYNGTIIHATRRLLGTNPGWQAKHSFYCPSRAECMIVVKIVDGEEVVGELSLHLDDLLDGNKSGVNWWPLSSCASGDLKMDAIWTGVETGRGDIKIKSLGRRIRLVCILSLQWRKAKKLSSIIPLLSRALHRIRSTPPRIIASPPTRSFISLVSSDKFLIALSEPRRAAVALIIRVVPSPSTPAPPTPTNPPTLTEFFEQEWVNDPNARPEILFLHRHNASADEISLAQQSRLRSTQESHVAFPGGRMEPEDEGGLYTAMRQTWEEIGVDLAERQYTCVGQLDDREITTSLGKRLLMILSPFVFLQVSPQAPPPDPIESTTLHWTPLASLVSPLTPPRWSTVTVDAASRLAPKHNTALRLLVRLLIGTMEFPAILLDTSSSGAGSAALADSKSQSTLEKGVPARPPQSLKLWGLSLGMTLDLMSYMIFAPPTSRFSNPQEEDAESAASSPLLGSMPLPYQAEFEGLRMDVVAPSLASVFPRFSYPDVNFWIWVFGKRYRSVVRGWEASVRSGGTNDRRINWSGSALSTFYAAIRKALVVVIVARALGILFSVAFALWWVIGRQ
ncbi:hypothetical protein DXG01_009504 [Tephrocybe rancida]|nr:hypothetical protein DXG01_009504 [Tephrocybe rancida]